VAAIGIILLLLVTASVHNTPFAPAWLAPGRDTRVTAELGNGLPQHPLPRRETMGYTTKEMVAPDVPYAEQVKHQFANYDRIVVEVHRDGSLSVLGKIMPMDAFRSLLGDQQQDGVQTVVAIQAEHDCLYRHIGRVIRLCEDMGIPHLMVAEPVPSTVTAAPPAPA
jgi:biopolymer transport protein ExbD